MKTYTLTTFFEGQRLGDIWGYTSIGLFQNEQDVTDWLANNDQSFISNQTWFPGDVKYKDITGDGKVDNGSNTIDDHGDLSIIGNSNPRYQFSFDLDLSWKGLSLRTFWQGIAKRQIPVGGPYFYGLSGDQWQAAAFKEHLDYWTPENPNAYYARPTFILGGRNQQTQTRYLQNGAYLRLKNITLSYQIPSTLLNKTFIKGISLFATGENVLTFTKLTKIFDPEVVSGWDWGKIYPLSKVYAAGINITL